MWGKEVEHKHGKVFPRCFSELEVWMMHKPWYGEVAGKAQGAVD